MDYVKLWEWFQLLITSHNLPCKEFKMKSNHLNRKCPLPNHVACRDATDSAFPSPTSSCGAAQEEADETDERSKSELSFSSSLQVLGGFMILFNTWDNLKRFPNLKMGILEFVWSVPELLQDDTDTPEFRKSDCLDWLYTRLINCEKKTLTHL